MGFEIFLPTNVIIILVDLEWITLTHSLIHYQINTTVIRRVAAANAYYSFVKSPKRRRRCFLLLKQQKEDWKNSSP